MESKEGKNNIAINGNMDGNIIVGDNNQIHVSSTGAEKTASELAIQRLKEEIKMLRNSYWEFITSEIVQEKDPSITSIGLGIFTGKIIERYSGGRFYDVASRIEGFSINGEKVKKTRNEQEMIQGIWNMSSQEVQQVIDCLPLALDGKRLEGTKKFGERVLSYVVKIEERIIEYRKHKAIVQA